MRMYAVALLLLFVSSFPFHHTCYRISSPRHSWLKFCPSCSSGNSAVHAPLTAAIRAVNCWRQFHSDLESAGQQAKAFAFKALKLIWNASLCLSVQLAAQVLDDLDDEDIGFGLVDQKKDSAVAKKLGKLASHWQKPCMAKTICINN